MTRIPHRATFFTALVVLACSVPFFNDRFVSQRPANSNAQAKQEAIAHNNLGIAYMNRQDERNALSEFEKAYSLDPALYAARLNQAIALLNLERFPPALAILEEAAVREPRNPRTWYNLGLIERSLGHTQISVQNFERVTALDPQDADTQYFLGQDYLSLNQYGKAIAAFERALHLDPFHASSEFALAQAYERSGHPEQARGQLIRFQHLTETKLGKPMSLTYGDQGKYSLAEKMSPGIEPVPAQSQVHFVDVTAQSGLPSRWATRPAKSRDPAEDFGSGACVFDYDGDGKPDIFLGNDGTGHAALYHNLGDGQFANVISQSGIDLPGPAIGCTAGDFDNDGHPGLAVSYRGGVALFQNEGDGTFKNVTSESGINVTGVPLGLTFVDYDQDGDLDLYVSRGSNSSPSLAGPSSNELWRNNGNGAFTNVTRETGLANPGGSWGATASDINNDRAVDFVVASMHRPPAIYFNPREGAFRAAVPWEPAMTSPAVGVVAFDFNKDGWMDLAFTHSRTPGISLWRNVDGKKFTAVLLPELGWGRGWGLVTLDYDHDGWIDIAAVGTNSSGGHIVLLRNEGAAGFRNVSQDVGLDQIRLTHPRSLVSADFFGDGSSDLLVTQAGGPPVLLRNMESNRNHWLRLTLHGLVDNRSAIGTKVQVFAGTLRQKFEIRAASGYLGQSDISLDVGLDSATKADIVRMLWPTGVLQDEINFPVDGHAAIEELDRHGSSCPLLFSWDGHHFKFIDDILGAGIVGHWIAPRRRNIPDPEEYMKVQGSDAQPRKGLLSFRLLEPMEELDYLDQVRLVAVDHPAGVEVYSNSHFAMRPPFPQFKVIAIRRAHPPLGAWDNYGRNELPVLLVRDHRFVDGFQGLSFAGLAKMHWLELDLGEWNPHRPLRLLMDGFTDYFSADSLYAARQAGMKPIPPFVEAQDSSGRWHRVIQDMGFPAGLERSMVVDLTGKLPAGTRRIRIVTNLKVYWDRIRIDNSPLDVPHRVINVPLVEAKLDFRGYPRYIEGKTSGDLSYVYDDISATGPYAQQSGNYTRYGDVLPLLTHADEKYAIFGSGDEVALSFDPSLLPKLSHGWVRDYFFCANGFDKDMDIYAAFGATVTPLPIHSLLSYPYPKGAGYPYDRSHVEYYLHYNTREVSGAPPRSYLFHYRPEQP
ncbi:MAG: FG-GAP-like repeat-containing protein [Candidatus Acidiferrales bacterium]